MKYVFFGPDFKPQYVMLRKLFDRADVQCIRMWLNSYRQNKLSEKVKFLCPLFAKYDMSLVEVKEDDEIVFVYSDRWDYLAIRIGLIEKLKKKYPNSLHYFSFNDVIMAHDTDIELLKKHFDALFIYDESEAMRLGVRYQPATYAKYHSEVISEYKYDVTYVGHIRDRYEDIMRLYEACKDAGLKIGFYLVGVPEDQRQNKDGIVYSDRYLSEEEYYEGYIATTRCMIDIPNKGSRAFTSRTREAIMYDRKLLSCNPALREYKYYSEEMMQVYDDPSDIDFSFLEKEGSYDYEGDFEPEALLKCYEKVYHEIKGQNA